MLKKLCLEGYISCSTCAGNMYFDPLLNLNNCRELHSFSSQHVSSVNSVAFALTWEQMSF